MYNLLDPRFFIINITEELVKRLCFIQPGTSVGGQSLHSIKYIHTSINCNAHYYI